MKVEMEWEVRVRETWAGLDPPPHAWEHVGRGATPDEALQQLQRNIDKAEKHVSKSRGRLLAFRERASA